VSASRQAVASERSRGTGGRPNYLVALVTRLVVAQAGLTGAIGVSYSRRNWPWIVAALMLAVALCGLAAMLRSGGHSAWIFAVGFESAFIALGLFRFFTARFLGGTLFGLITLGVLVHPAVIRAFGGLPGSRSRALGDTQLSEFGSAAGEAFGGRAPG
jgi:O-antigen ligase